MTKEDTFEDWDYKEELKIEPCECHYKCGNYVLLIKGKHLHAEFPPPKEEFIEVCSLPMGLLYDLIRNCQEKIDLEDKKKELDSLIVPE